MALIKISNLTFGYDGYENIFENMSFQIDTDWKLGFTGRNGRGKTTFLNLLLGRYEYSGTISASCPFEYFPYNVSDARAPVLDVVYDVCGGAQEWEICRELGHLDVDESVLPRPFDTLSGGERTKVLIAAMFLRMGAFMLMDEPTNHLDMAGRGALGAYLRRKKGFILVSHDRTLLDGCCDHILSINRTGVEVQRGNFSVWMAERERKEAAERAENEKLQREIGRLKEAAERTAQWASAAEGAKFGTRIGGLRPDRGYLGRKAAKVMKRGKSMEARQQTAIEAKSELLGNVEQDTPLKIFPVRYHSQGMVSLRDVSIFYGSLSACRGVSFTVERSERVAISGKNGCGKSSVLKLICGHHLEYAGELKVGGGLNISYVPQDASFLAGSLAQYGRVCGVDEGIFKAVLSQLGFQRVQFEKDMASFSAGQKKKVLIAASLCSGAHLLVWDEPLNFIDVISRMQIESLLLRSGPTVVFVEHDAAFCRNVATKTVSL